MRLHPAGGRGTEKNGNADLGGRSGCDLQCHSTNAKIGDLDRPRVTACEIRTATDAEIVRRKGCPEVLAVATTGDYSASAGATCRVAYSRANG